MGPSGRPLPPIRLPLTLDLAYLSTSSLLFSFFYFYIYCDNTGSPGRVQVPTASISDRLTPSGYAALLAFLRFFSDQPLSFDLPLRVVAIILSVLLGSLIFDVISWFEGRFPRLFLYAKALLLFHLASFVPTVFISWARAVIFHSNPANAGRSQSLEGSDGFWSGDLFSMRLDEQKFVLATDVVQNVAGLLAIEAYNADLKQYKHQLVVLLLHILLNTRYAVMRILTKSVSGSFLISNVAMPLLVQPLFRLWRFRTPGFFYNIPLFFIGYFMNAWFVGDISKGISNSLAGTRAPWPPFLPLGAESWNEIFRTMGGVFGGLTASESLAPGWAQQLILLLTIRTAGLIYSWVPGLVPLYIWIIEAFTAPLLGYGLFILSRFARFERQRHAQPPQPHQEGVRAGAQEPIQG